MGVHGSRKLLWKVVGIVLAVITVFYGLKTFKRAMSVRLLHFVLEQSSFTLRFFQDASTRPKSLPAFGTSLGCSTALYVYNKTSVKVTDSSSVFDISGDSVGTIIIADGPADSTDIMYALTLRTTKKSLLDKIKFSYPDRAPEGTALRINTPPMTGLDAWHCMRYDVKIFMPPRSKSLRILTNTVAHIGFEPGATIAKVNQLTVMLQAPDARNILALSSSAVPLMQHYEAYGGFIVGEASIVRDMVIETKRGNGVANVTIFPAQPRTPQERPAILWTVGGAGRSDYVYMGSKVFERNISAVHAMGGTGDMSLTYREATVNGLLSMTSNTYTLTGAQTFQEGESEKWGTTWDGANWTHFVGKVDGGDSIQVINPRGWTGLSF